jgi:hypothetical protein
MVELFFRYNAWLHVRLEGRSWDMPLSVLNLGPLSPDNHILIALARYLNVPDECLSFYSIERHADGCVTVRPPDNLN